MKQTFWGIAAVCAAASLMLAQPPAAGNGKAKAKADRPKAQSPASQTRPKSVTQQQFPAEQVAAGEAKFFVECGFCHGRDAAGGESGPDLTRSELVATDVGGDKIGPLLAKGVPDEGMPAFKLSAADQAAIVAFIHTQKTKYETLGGDRREVDPTDLDTGNAEAGKRYFSGAGQCSKCHSATGDLAGIGTRFQGLALIQRMLYPSGRPAPARPKITVTLANGQKVSGSLTREDEFSVTVQGADNQTTTYEKDKVQVAIDNPLSAHYDQLGKYTDRDMHDVYAYLNTLK